jgi:hypothetical protein
MLQTFRATLRGYLLEWGEEVQHFSKDDRPVQVLVTILEEEAIQEKKGRGRSMADVLEKIAQSQDFSGIDPIAWQRDMRQDRELPGRDE